ncbi:MAG: penicillin-binding protein activator LpoB [Planctomycetes bacterium]|nr:penicillin-binding protein activator LpoB [Planctomycetota bacterium]
MNKLLLLTLSAIVLSAGFSSCTSSTTTRTDAGGARDLSGKWNAQDSKLTATWIKDDIIKRPWVGNHVSAKGKKPYVRIGNITVASIGEVINTDVFVNEIRMELVNSGTIGVRSGKKSGDTRKIIKESDLHASDATRKAAAEEIGADYLLTGSINVQFDANGRHKDKTYAVDMELRNIETQEIVWVGRKEINKQVDRKLFH